MKSLTTFLNIEFILTEIHENNFNEVLIMIKIKRTIILTLISIFLFFLTFIGDVSAIASSGNYYLSRGVAIGFTTFTLGILFFARKKFKLPLLIFHFFWILNAIGLCYSSSMLLVTLVESLGLLH